MKRYLVLVFLPLLFAKPAFPADKKHGGTTIYGNCLFSFEPASAKLTRHGNPGLLSAICRTTRCFWSSWSERWRY